MMTAFLLLAACVGFLSTCKFLLILIHFTWTAFLRPPQNLKRFGSWALVTGPTEGIGKAIALQLASHGLNIVLVGRNPAKLGLVAEEIRGVAVRTVVIDFAEAGGEKLRRKVEEETRGIDVGIVVNNVGLSYPYARFLHETDAGLIESVVRVNAVTTTAVTAAVVEGMMKRRCGVVVNIGSGSAGHVSSHPLNSVYSGTKAYVTMLSKSINAEYKDKGIIVQCQIPFVVATKMSSIRKTSFFIPSPEAYAKASLRWIGHRQQVCIPYWPHALQAAVLTSLPEVLVDAVALKYFIGMRARGLRKDSRKRDAGASS